MGPPLERTQGSVTVAAVRPNVKDASRQGTGGTRHGVATAALSDHFATHSVLLIIEFEGGTGCMEQIGGAGCKRVEDDKSDRKSDVPAS